MTRLALVNGGERGSVLHIIMGKHAISSILFSLIALTGCRMNQAVYNEDGSRIIYTRPPLMKVVEELDERHLSVDGVMARLSVTLHDIKKNKEFPLTGVYLGDKDGNLRLRISATTNQVILDMGVHGDTVEIWLPRKERYFTGKLQDLLNNSQSQFSLLAHAGRARDLFFPRAWTASAIERRVTYEHGREVVSVIEKPNFIRRRSRRLTLAPESPVVESVEVYDRFGREVGTVGYSDYRFPEVTENLKPGSCPVIYPNCIKMQSHDNTHLLEMNVDEIILNPTIAKDKFEIPPPEKMKLLDLGDALKRNGNLWE